MTAGVMKLQSAGRSTTVDGYATCVCGLDEGCDVVFWRLCGDGDGAMVKLRRVERGRADHMGAASLERLRLAVGCLPHAENEGAAAVKLHEDREVAHARP